MNAFQVNWHETRVALTRALESPATWLLPQAKMCRALVECSGETVAESLNAVSGERSFCFVNATELPAGEAYEAFIARTQRIPTRDNLHDLFNGLMWLTYPQTKRRLNALQAREITRLGTSGPRGALRDALTLFDENAAFLRAPEGLLDDLRRRDWRALFVEHRHEWQSARLVVFGHALLEKLMTPRKAITAHVWVVDALTDDAIAASLQPERLTAKPFLPLPVLGVPGWWSANENPAFYDDREVFRPARSND